MKILLTGANGFIGKNIKESYLSEKHAITAPSSKELNLIDTASVDNFFKGKTFDVVIHLACKPGHRNALNPTNLFYSNVRMFENLARHKDKYCKFINLGSGAVYDTSTDIVNAKEEDVFKNIPADEHGFCKYVVSKRIEKLNNFIDLNIFGIFGKYEDWEIRFISNAICKALYGLPITLRQNRVFSYLWVDDLISILEFFIEGKPKHKFYNIVPDEKTDLVWIANLVKEISGKNIEIKIGTEGSGLEYTASNSRLKKELNIKFTPLKEAVLKLYGYYKTNISMIDKNKLFNDK
jgi:GDP-L-fucose synthase